jgi:hypothetical protein
MSLRKFVSFVLGAAVVLGLGAVGLVYAYGRAHTVHAQEAAVESDVSTVGTPFGGSIQSIQVRPGDPVSTGQEIARLQSPSLAQAVKTGGFLAEGIGYHIEGKDVLVFTATVDGTVSTADHTVGSFVPANTTLAEVEVAGTSRITARVPMSAADYARMSVGSPMPAVLPDGTKVTTEIFDVQFEDGGAPGEALAVVKGRSDELAAAGSFTNGSPAVAAVELDDAEGLGSWAARQLTELITPDGTSI